METSFDNIIKTIENEREEYEYSKEDKDMNNINAILKDAVAVWTSFVGDKKTRFERLVDGKWFDWGTHVIYDDAWFRNALSQMEFGKEYVVEYA